MRTPPRFTLTLPSLRPLATATLAALALTACTTEDVEPGDDDPEAAAAEERTAEIMDNLEQAGFPADDITVDDEGQVFVGGDAVVTLEASREMVGLTRLGEEHEHGDDEFRQYRTTNVVAAAIDDICINGTALTPNANLSAGLDGAIANYNHQNLTFDMRRINGPIAAGCDVVITMVLSTGSGASAGFPVGGLPHRTVYVGSGVGGYGIPASTHVITHELGHCIGFRHTDYYDRGISGCPGGGNEGQSTTGAHHIPNTPTTAVWNGSIMNACYNAGSTGVWNPEDVDALQQLYGRDCCAVGGGAGCGNVLVNECVGAVDPYCNDGYWDAQCVNEVTSLGCGSCPAQAEHSCCSSGSAGCSDNVIEAAICGAGGIDGAGAVDPYCCDTAWDGACVNGVNALPNNVALPCGSTCCAPHGTPGCDDASVQACVGAVDSYCTTTAWDGLCVAEVETLGCSHCS